MKDRCRITEKELSFYYDGLLDEERRQRVEETLKDDSIARHRLETYALFDEALQPDLSREEIDNLLANNATEIHQKLLQPVKRTESFWAFLLAPRALAGACVVLMLFSATLFQFESTNFSTPNQDDQVVVTEAQRLAMQAITDYTKSALGRGVGMAAQQSGTLQETFSALEQQQPGALLALGAIRSTLDATGAKASADDEQAENQQPIRRLIHAGIQQVALGIGMSILGLLSVF